MVIRVSIANLDLADGAKLGQASGMPGTIYPNVGFGNWGVEPGVTFEFAGQPKETVRDWVREVLASRGEQSAYATIDGSPHLWHAEDLQESL